jgi:hypothetical protein
MKQNKIILNLIFILTVAFAGMDQAIAQDKKVAPTSKELFNEIARQDSLLFEAFNTQNMNKFKPMFAQDLEWYQDNGGLLSYKTVFENFDANFKKEFKLTRKLVNGSLEVHPIKEYGAIEIGVHQFTHVENGKEETGTFKFLAIWRKTNDQWQISRMISYDH